MATVGIGVSVCMDSSVASTTNYILFYVILQTNVIHISLLMTVNDLQPNISEQECDNGYLIFLFAVITSNGFSKKPRHKLMKQTDHYVNLIFYYKEHCKKSFLRHTVYLRHYLDHLSTRER